MKHIKTFEGFLNEKVYRLSGAYSSKGIIGKVMQAFKKTIEKVKFEGDWDVTLAEINKKWKSFEKDGNKIILDDVEKVVKTLDNVAFINVNGFTLDWVKAEDSGLNRHIKLTNDFVINVGFRDDVDGSRFSRRLGGMMNTPIISGNDIYGVGDGYVGYNNCEIREVEVMMLDGK